MTNYKNFLNKLTIKADEVRTQVAMKKAETQSITETQDVATLLQGIATPDGGATFNLNGTVPTVGFCASPYPEFSKVYEKAEDVTFAELTNFVAEVEKVNPTIFAEENTYLGLWNDPETGKIYLDVSKHYMNALETRKVCLENDQIAFFDLNTFESVDVDRNALSGQM